MQIHETYEPDQPNNPYVRIASESLNGFHVNHRHREYTEDVINSLSAKELLTAYDELQTDIRSLETISAELPETKLYMKPPLNEVTERDRSSSEIVMNMILAKLSS